VNPSIKAASDKAFKKRILALAAVSLAVVGLGAAGSYWIRARAQAKFEGTLEGDLDLLTKLLQFRGKLRQVELSSDNYLLTGDSHWLERRGDAIREAGEMERLLSKRMLSRQDAEDWDSFGMELTAYFAGQEFWIRRKMAGALPASKATHLVVLNDSMDDITQRLMDLREKSVDEFQRHRLELQRASLWFSSPCS
jgi:hypothetical protein